MVKAICPECGKRGSLHEGCNKEDNRETKYWYVYHSNRSNRKTCYIGTSPQEVEIIEDGESPVGTKKVTVDDETDPKRL